MTAFHNISTIGLRSFAAGCLAFVLLAGPAAAQNDKRTDSTKAEEAKSANPAPDTRERRLQLAERMHEIWSTRERINRALERMAQRYPESERDSFINAMQLAIDYGRIEEKSIDAMTRTFTVAELEAMVDYYGSEAGQSAENKRSIYQDRIQPVIQTMIDKALMAYRTGETGQSNQ
jgi:hypothetical protein